LNISTNILNNPTELRDLPSQLIVLLTDNISRETFDCIYNFKTHSNCSVAAITPYKRKDSSSTENLRKLTDSVFNLPLKISLFHDYVKDLNFESKTSSSPQNKQLFEHIKSMIRDRGGCNILVAEDNMVNQRVIIRILEELGANFIMAKDGSEAVRRYRENYNRLDMILMDLNMPEISGTEVTRIIREEEELALLTSGVSRHTIIVGISADDTSRDLCLASGMDFFASKPYRFAQIARLMEIWIK